MSSLVNINLIGSLSDGDEYALGPFPETVEVTGISPNVLVAPITTSLVVRVQDSSGASPTNFIEAIMPVGSTVLAAMSTGSFSLPSGNPLYIRVVAGSSAEFLGGFIQLDGLNSATGPSGLRTRRNWNQMLVEIRRILREPVAATSYWSDADLLDMFNRNLDLRVMDMAEAHEGWVTSVVVTDVVANQSIYDIPEGSGRLKRVVFIPEAGTSSIIEIPLMRNERWAESVATSTAGFGGVDQGVPTYRLVGSQLILEPAPKKGTVNGLRLELEHAQTRLVLGTDLLSPAYPDVLETLLVYDTAVEAMEIESAMGNVTPETYFNTMSLKRDRYDKKFEGYIAVRSFGPTFGAAFSLGD